MWYVSVSSSYITLKTLLNLLLLTTHLAAHVTQ